MLSWPRPFPQFLAVVGLSVEPVSNSIPIEVESGEPLTRLRFTGEMDVISGVLPPVSQAVAIDILNFWRYDLKQGTLRFSYDHPLSGEAAEFLFIDRPRFEIIRGGLWRVSIKLQTMPP